jgi:argininosuccinate synthase
METRRRIVLAYAGATGPGATTSADTLVAIAGLIDRYDAEVVTVTLDFGQIADAAGVRDRAIAAGAVRTHVLDFRETVVREYMIPVLKAGALGVKSGPLGVKSGALGARRRSSAAALTRPLIAQALVDVAHMEEAIVVAHGCVGGDRTRLEELIRELEPNLELVAVDTAEKMRAGDAKPIRNGGRALAQEAAFVEITFERGTPVAVNRVPMSLVDLMESLGTIAAAHGVDAADVVLHESHRDLMKFVTSADVQRFSRSVASQYAAVLERGLWFTPFRAALDAFVESVQARVSGVVRLRLSKGQCRIVGRTSAFALHSVPPEPVRSIHPVERVEFNDDDSSLVRAVR